MIDWKSINNHSDLKDINELSYTKDVLIFKHSTRCSISSMMKTRLEQNWDSNKTKLDTFLLDLITHRDISNQISSNYKVHHESPQIIVISNGKSVLDLSHLDISFNYLIDPIQPIK